MFYWFSVIMSRVIGEMYSLLYLDGCLGLAFQSLIKMVLIYRLLNPDGHYHFTGLC